jgi:hypothetical protein
MGERVRESQLPLGWIVDHVEIPGSWTVDFYESGRLLRFRREISRDEYGVNPPGYPGVGICSGRDWWQITGDTDRVIRDVWGLPEEKGHCPIDVIQAVEEAIGAVEDDLERVKLSNWLDECVPGYVVENLIERFETAAKVARVEDDTPLLESVEGVGAKRRQAIQQRFGLLRMDDDWVVDQKTDRDGGGR